MVSKSRSLPWPWGSYLTVAIIALVALVSLVATLLGRSLSHFARLGVRSDAKVVRVLELALPGGADAGGKVDDDRNACGSFARVPRSGGFDALVQFLVTAVNKDCGAAATLNLDLYLFAPPSHSSQCGTSYLFLARGKRNRGSGQSSKTTLSRCQ